RVLARDERPGLVFEDQSNDGKAEKRKRAIVQNMRDAAHGELDRNRDLLLHFFRGVAGPLRDDLNARVGDVRIGLDREIREREDPPRGDRHAQAKGQNAVCERKANRFPDHEPSPVNAASSRSPPSLTASSPSLRPWETAIWSEFSAEIDSATRLKMFPGS